MKGTTFTFQDDGPSVLVRFVGSKELDLTLDGERHRGVLQEDGSLHWDDGDIWRRDVEAGGSSRFGIHLHSRVRLLRACSGMPAGMLGVVVGFASERVEVKF